MSRITEVKLSRRSFVGGQKMPPGHALYPPDLTRDEIDRYVTQHPDQKSALYAPQTVITRTGPALSAVPYHVEFNAEMRAAADALRRAAALSSDRAFAAFRNRRRGELLRSADREMRT